MVAFQGASHSNQDSLDRLFPVVQNALLDRGLPMLTQCIKDYFQMRMLSRKLTAVMSINSLQRVVVLERFKHKVPAVFVAREMQVGLHIQSVAFHPEIAPGGD
jgi:hypothetical protein